MNKYQLFHKMKEIQKKNCRGIPKGGGDDLISLLLIQKNLKIISEKLKTNKINQNISFLKSVYLS